MSVQLDIRELVEAALLLVPWACLKLAFVFCQMVLKLPCSLLKTLSAVQNTLRAVKEVFHNYSDVDGELGNGKTSNAQMHVYSFCFLFYFVVQIPCIWKMFGHFRCLEWLLYSFP